MIERRPRAPVLRSIALLAIERQRLVLEGQVDVLHLEQALVLLDQRVLRLLQDPLQRVLVEVLERREHRQAADELGDQAELQQVLGLDLRGRPRRCGGRPATATVAPKPIEVPLPRGRDDPLEARRRRRRR